MALLPPSSTSNSKTKKRKTSKMLKLSRLLNLKERKKPNLDDLIHLFIQLIYHSIKDFLCLIDLELLKLLNKTYFGWLHLVHKQNTKKMIDFVLKNNWCHILQLRGNFFSFFIQKLDSYFSRPFNISSNAWDRKASLPKSLGIFIEYCNLRINDDCIRMRFKFTIPWIVLRHLYKTNTFRNSDLRGSNA